MSQKVNARLSQTIWSLPLKFSLPLCLYSPSERKTLSQAHFRFGKEIRWEGIEKQDEVK